MQKVLSELEAGGNCFRVPLPSEKREAEGNEVFYIISETKASLMTSSIRNRRKISDLSYGTLGIHEKCTGQIGHQVKRFLIWKQKKGLARRNKVSHTEVGVQWSQRVENKQITILIGRIHNFLENS